VGAWGAGTFENDDAMDWVYELAETDDDTLLVESLHAAARHPKDEYLEVPICARALAAAEVVAALTDGIDSVLPDEAREWVRGYTHVIDRRHVPLALQAIGRIRGDSELKGLWDDSDDEGAWYAVLTQLESRMQR
jgi:hypothetical protein